MAAVSRVALVRASERATDGLVVSRRAGDVDTQMKPHRARMTPPRVATRKTRAVGLTHARHFVPAFVMRAASNWRPSADFQS